MSNAKGSGRAARSVRTQAQTEEGPYLLSLEQAGRRLGVSEGMVRKMAQQGKIQTVPLGRRRLVPRAEVERIACLPGSTRVPQAQQEREAS